MWRAKIGNRKSENPLFPIFLNLYVPADTPSAPAPKLRQTYRTPPCTLPAAENSPNGGSTPRRRSREKPLWIFSSTEALPAGYTSLYLKRITGCSTMYLNVSVSAIWLPRSLWRRLRLHSNRQPTALTPWLPSSRQRSDLSNSMLR